MPNPKFIPQLLLLASFGLFAGCATLPSAPVASATSDTAASNTEESSNSPEERGEDDVAGPIPHVELTSELLYRLLAAEFAWQNGAPATAAEVYLKGASETRDPRLAKRATRLALYGDAQGVALRAATLWSDLAPDDLDANQALASLYIGAGRSEEARPQLQKLVAAPAMQQGRGYLICANLLARDNNKERALAIMEELLKGHRHEAEPLYAYATLAAAQENIPVAMQSLDEMLRLQPHHIQGLVLKARLLHGQGQQDEALATLKRAVDEAPKNGQLRLIYARMLVDARHLEQAQREFRILNRQTPDNPDVLYALGLLALQSNDPEEGEKSLQRLLQLGEHESEANYALGQLAENRNQVDKAIGYYEAVEDSDNRLDARLRTALLISRRDGLAKGRAYLHTIDTNTPAELVRIALFEGELLRDAGEYAEAMAVYDEAIVLFPENSDLLYARAMIAERLDRLDILEQDLRAILRQTPDNTQALNALGYTLADRTNRLEEAHSLVAKALQLAPDDGAVLDSMGWVLYRMGQHQQALDYLRRALAQQNDPEIAAHLGEVLWVMGQQKEARKIWNNALKQWPEHPVLNQTLKRLSQ